MPSSECPSPALTETAAIATFQDSHIARGVRRTYRITAAQSEGGSFYQLRVDSRLLSRYGLTNIGPYDTTIDALNAGREHFAMWVEGTAKRPRR